MGHIRLMYLFFINHLSSLPILLSNPPARLSSGGVSELEIIDYWHFHRLFLHQRLKIDLVQISVILVIC